MKNHHVWRRGLYYRRIQHPIRQGYYSNLINQMKRVVTYMKKERKVYKNFGECLFLSDDHVTLGVTLEVGPRIIYLAAKDGENLFFEDTQGELTMDGPEMQEAFGPESVFKLYGGHRLWVSPESIFSYYPDNEPVTLTENGNTFRFSAPVQRVTGLQCEMEVVFKEGGHITVNHYITNRSQKEQTLALWALTVTDKRGRSFLKWNSHKTGFLSNRIISLWDYTDITDPRALFGRDWFELRQDPGIDCAFKMGADIRSGFVVLLNKNTAFIKRFAYENDAIYPDGGCNYETYTNAHMMEIETLSPLRALAPGQTASHTEHWQVIPNVPQDISAETFENNYLI